MRGNITFHFSENVKITEMTEVVSFCIAGHISGIDNSLGNPDSVENEFIHIVGWIVTENSHYIKMTLPYFYTDNVVLWLEATEVQCPIDLEK